MSDQKLQKNWPGDHLNRWEDANYLTNYLCTRYEKRIDSEGFALAVNAGWGKGKSFLLKRWHDDLETNKYPVVHFDAWKNDFTPEPLIGFIASLNDGLEPHIERIPTAKTAMKSIRNAIQTVAKPAMSAITTAFMIKALGMGVDELAEFFEVEQGKDSEKKGIKNAPDLQKALSKVADTALIEHKNKARAIQLCKEQLEFIVEELSKQNTPLPLFIFIDELDRCRPDFAIELLEGIKHLFGVRGVYFVIAVNMNELAASVKAVYGQDFSSRNYLKRFFDLEYTLGEPSSDEFSANLISQLELPVDRFIWSKKVRHINTPAKLLSYYAQYFGLTLRDMQQVGKLIEAACLSLKGKIHVSFLFFLASYYQKSPALYSKNKGKSPFSDEIYKKMLRDEQPSNFVGNFTLNTNDQQTGKFHTYALTTFINNYYTFINDEPNKFSQREFNSTKFPEDLYAELQSETYDKELSISNYFDVIQHAGKLKIVDDFDLL